jgi:hypothetical protein
MYSLEGLEKAKQEIRLLADRCQTDGLNNAYKRLANCAGHRLGIIKFSLKTQGLLPASEEA